MKRLLYYTSFIPLIGSLLIYIYIFYARFEIKGCFYNTDPKQVNISFIHDTIGFLFLIGIVYIILSFFLLVVNFFLKKKLIERSYFFIYSLSVAIYFIQLGIDPYNYISWFFD